MLRLQIFRQAVSLLSLCILFGSAVVRAELDERGPEQMTQHATSEMLVAIDEAKTYYSEDPERFFAEVDRILLPVVDFQGFARGVMGYYGSVDAYRKLDTAEQKAGFKERIKRFDPLLRATMVNSYSKGLLAVKVETIDILPLEPEMAARIEAGETAQVIQLVKSPGEEPYEIKYLFKRSRQGEWKVRNVDVDGVDLGKIYRSQFAAAVRDYDGDVDQAIANWSEEEQPETLDAEAG
jgi:phospholipid transport system substrate-binding protein